MHDVAIVQLRAPKKVRECGKPRDITIVVKNLGNQGETVTVTLIKGEEIVEQWTVILAPKDRETLKYIYDPKEDGGQTISWTGEVEITEDYDLANNESGPSYTEVSLCK